MSKYYSQYLYYLMNSISYVIKKVLLDILSNEICRK
jgi:hypothetical protein